MNRIRPIRISCAPATAPFLAMELEALGYKIYEQQATQVTTKGMLDDCMRLNLWLRTAHRVMLTLAEFQAVHADELYKQMRNFPWEQYINPDGYLSIDSFTRTESIRDNRFANLRLKDAIMDRIKAKKGRRPDAGPDKSRTCLFLHWIDNQVSVALDTSGETISRHGYRQNSWKAPLMESLASSIILASRWKPEKGNFVNPMCGSGTLAIEALQMSQNMPPNLYRKNFGFMHVLGYEERRWQYHLNLASRNLRSKPAGRFLATDISAGAIQAARENAAAAGVEQWLELDVCDFKRTPVPKASPFSALILNPAWGDRLGETEKLKEHYQEIGDFFKKECKGYWAYLFTTNTELAKSVGLRTSRKIPFVVSREDARLLEYELYEGSRKN